MKTYIPKEPCKRGHYERYKSTNGCVECQKMHSNERHKDNPEYLKEWKSNPVNKARQQAVYNMRINNRRLGTKWDDVLTWIYLERPKGYVCDHIDPLDGENASGLHTPWNLQYLLHGENSNQKKSLPEYETKSAIPIDWRKYENKMLP